MEAADSTSKGILDLIAKLLFESRAANGFLDLPALSHQRLLAMNDQPLNEVVLKTSDEVARSLALSPRQFRRLFKQHTAMTFSQWRVIARVGLGIEKIATGQSITSVASDLAFSSSSAFAEAVKRCTGMKPTEFTVSKSG